MFGTSHHWTEVLQKQFDLLFVQTAVCVELKIPLIWSVICTNSDASELQIRLAAVEQENKKLTDALSSEKMTKLELTEKTDDLSAQLSKQRKLLLESERGCISLLFQAILLAYCLLWCLCIDTSNIACLIQLQPACMWMHCLLTAAVSGCPKLSPSLCRSFLTLTLQFVLGQPDRCLNPWISQCLLWYSLMVCLYCVTKPAQYSFSEYIL